MYKIGLLVKTQIYGYFFRYHSKKQNLPAPLVGIMTGKKLRKVHGPMTIWRLPQKDLSLLCLQENLRAY